MTRSSDDVTRVAELVRSGLSPYAIARVTGVPRQTIRYWLAQGLDSVLADGRRAACDGDRCQRVESVPVPAYAYLLGQYLGDGHIATHRRGVYRLVISCCDWYPAIIEECAAAMREVLPLNKVGFRNRQGVTLVSSYSKHWPCLFPQHGTGHKHERLNMITISRRASVALLDEFVGPKS